MPHNTNPDKDRLILASCWNDHYLWPPPGGLRHLIFNAEKKKFTKCVVRKSGRVFISEKSFHEWMMEDDSDETKRN